MVRVSRAGPMHSAVRLIGSVLWEGVQGLCAWVLMIGMWVAGFALGVTYYQVFWRTLCCWFAVEGCDCGGP